MYVYSAQLSVLYSIVLYCLQCHCTLYYPLCSTLLPPQVTDRRVSRSHALLVNNDGMLKLVAVSFVSVIVQVLCFTHLVAVFVRMCVCVGGGGGGCLYTHQCV